jgi:hypothetical protein
VTPPRSRWLALALALSLALHVLAWLGMSRIGVPAMAARERGSQTVELELQELVKTRVVIGVPPTLPSPRPSPLKGERVKRSQGFSDERSRLTKNSPSPPQGERPGEGAMRPEVAFEPALPADSPRALSLDAPDRSFDTAGPDAKPGSGGETIVGEPVAEAPAIRGKRAQQAIDGWIEDDAASARVEDGLIDPYFAQAGRSMEAAFKEGEKHAKSSHGRGATAAQSFLSGWSQSAQRFAATGNPNEPAGDLQDIQQRAGTLPRGAGPDSSQGELSLHGGSPAGMASLLAFADGSSGGLVAVVELRQTGAGKVVDLVLRHGSGDADFDQWVLASIPEGLAKLEPPPADGAGIHAKGLHSLWAFEGHVSYMRKVSDANLKDDWWYAPVGTVVGAMAGHFDIGSSAPEYFDPRHPHFVVDAKLLRVY